MQFAEIIRRWYERIQNTHETLLLFALIAVSSLTLFILCGLSFYFGRKRHLQKVLFSRYFFLAPLFVVLLTFSVYAGQHLTLKILPNAKSYFFPAQLMAIAWGVLISGIAVELRGWIPIPQTNQFYAYITLVISFFSMILFSFIDLRLLLVSFLQFLIIALTYGATQLPVLALAFLLQFVPAIPLVLQISYRHDRFFSKAAVFAPSLSISFLLALLAAPFLLLLIRLLISLGLWTRRKREQLLPIAVGAGVRMVVCILIMIGVVVYTGKKNDALTPQKAATLAVTVPETTPVTVKVKCTRANGLSAYELVFESGTPVARYDILVTPSEGASLLYSDYDYNLEPNNTYSFTLLPEESEDSFLGFTTDETAPGMFAGLQVTALSARLYPLNVELRRE